MTKEEFKRRWELDDRGDGITYEDIANCAIEWGLCAVPRIRPLDSIRKMVLEAAGVEEELYDGE